MKLLTALLLMGLLLLWTDLPAGDAWTCPRVQTTCQLYKPLDKCTADWQCPRKQKCCKSFCGRRCMRRPPAMPTSSE